MTQVVPEQKEFWVAALAAIMARCWSVRVAGLGTSAGLWNDSFPISAGARARMAAAPSGPVCRSSWTCIEVQTGPAVSFQYSAWAALGVSDIGSPLARSVR